MIAAIFLGAVLGLVAGVLYGALIAMYSRDGIWPEAWALLITVSTLCGAAFGVIAQLLSNL